MLTGAAVGTTSTCSASEPVPCLRHLSVVAAAADLAWLLLSWLCETAFASPAIRQANLLGRKRNLM